MYYYVGIIHELYVKTLLFYLLEVSNSLYFVRTSPSLSPFLVCSIKR